MDCFGDLPVAGGEIWQPVPTVQHLWASNHGRIFSLSVRRLLSQATDRGGYRYVHAGDRDHKKRKRTVHSLVMEAFRGERPLRMDINHIDFNRANNWLVNLAYVTRLQNVEHSREHMRGVVHRDNQEVAALASLSEGELVDIVEALRFGCTITSVSRRFRLPVEVVAKLAKSDYWGDVQ